MPEPVRYTRWEDIPAHLQTRTKLARQGLRPARGQSPVATMHNQRRPAASYMLYDVGQAIPKRPATPAQRAAHATAQQRAYAQRHEAEERAQRAAVVAWARATLADAGAVVLETKTTDLDGEVIEIAVLTMQGEVLLESLVCPTGGLGPLHPAATAGHGLTPAEVATAPTWAALFPQVAAVLARASRIVAWHSAGAYFTLLRTCALAAVEDLAPLTDKRWTYAMTWYAQWLGIGVRPMGAPSGRPWVGATGRVRIAWPCWSGCRRWLVGRESGTCTTTTAERPQQPRRALRLRKRQQHSLRRSARGPARRR